MAKVAEELEKKPIASEPGFVGRAFAWVGSLPSRIGAWFVMKARRSRQFYGDVKLEMKKVTWPTRDDVYAQTIVVLICLFFFGFFLYGTNQALGYLANKLIEYFSQ